jgi:hypothetical protein
MRAMTVLLALVTTLMWTAPPTYAIPVLLGTTLSGANEVPVVNSPGTGQALVTVDAAANTLLVNVTFSGLTAPTSAAHIHCCAPLGTNAPVATTVPAFPGFPLGVTSGTYSQTLDLTSAGSYRGGLSPGGFIDQNGGSVAAAEAVFIAGLLAGNTYLNIHTTANPGGEIRGQLQRVPEPASVLLVVVGLLGLGASAALTTRRIHHRELPG